MSYANSNTYSVMLAKLPNVKASAIQVYKSSTYILRCKKTHVANYSSELCRFSPNSDTYLSDGDEVELPEVSETSAYQCMYSSDTYLDR